MTLRRLTVYSAAVLIAAWVVFPLVLVTLVLILNLAARFAVRHRVGGR